jgi:hypothetical protein
VQNADKKSLLKAVASSMQDYLDFCAEEARAEGFEAEKIQEVVRQAADDLRTLVDCPAQCQLNYEKCIADGGDRDECLEQRTVCMNEC